MSFTTLTFGIFLVFVFALYWKLRGLRAQNWLILLSSCVFYGWWDFRFLFLLLFASLIDYLLGIRLDTEERPGARKAWLALGMSLNLGLLFFFKYFNFFIDSAVALAATLGLPFTRPELYVLLPVGISFYTFQTMTYSIDIYRRQLKPTRDFIAYMAYVSFFPQLVAGPIERATHLLPQFLSPRRFDEPRARDGLRLMLWGFMKKVLVADTMGFAVQQTFVEPGLQNGGMLALCAVFFTFQVYCDFSAYSDIAQGSAQLFGFDLMRNFDLPYFSRSLPEFWRRWHISLSTWFRDYVYLPLGGNRRGRKRQAFNLVLTFFLSGLWHGAAWHYVIWGLLHGILMAVSLLLGGRRKAALEKTHDSFALAAYERTRTFAIVALLLVIFRAQNMDDATLALWRIFTEGWQPAMLAGAVGVYPKATVVMLIFVATEWLTRELKHPIVLFERMPRSWRWAGYSLCIWVIICQGAHRPSDFIYFQF